MRPHAPKYCALIASLVLIAIPCPSIVSQAPGRRVLSANLAAPTQDTHVKALPAGQVLKFGLTLPLRNVPELQALLKQQQDPSSPQYHKYLSRQDFVTRFGPTAADYEQVQSFARSQGFTVLRTFENRQLVNVQATAAQVNLAFAVQMQQMKTADGARTYYAPDVEASTGSTAPLLSIVGLSTRQLPQPMLDTSKVKAIGGTTSAASRVKTNAAVQAFTTGSGPDGQFLGSDMRAAYAPGVTLAGEGQSVGLVELGPYNLSDVYAYFNLVNQPLNVPIYNIYLDVDGVCGAGCDDGEEVIDMEQAISMSPNMSGLLIYTAYGSGSDALTAFSQAASDDVVKQLSLSFGFGGTPSTQPGYEQVFMELAAQGQNVFVASGDSGANVGGVGYPGNSPNITDVGGTDLVTAGAGGPWQSESAWIGSGGGWSTQSPIPSYQVPVINSTNQGSPLYRNIPDVAMEANTDNIFCANGGCYEGIGGTSLAAPRWAGFLAMANQQASGFPIGFLNPIVYSIGQSTAYAADFHDIVTGDNFNTSSPNLFQATPGYDLTSGWGTPNGQSMLNQLAPLALASSPNFSLTASSSTLNLTPGQGASTEISVLATNGFTGSVNLQATIVGSPSGVTATLTSSTLPAGGQTTLNVDTTSGTPGGTYLVAVNGTSGSLQHTAYIKLALPDFGLTASPTKVYLNQQSSATDQITVSQVNGFSGSVTLSLTGLPPLVTGQLSPQTTSTSSTLTLTSQIVTPTTPGVPVSISGVSGGTTHVVPTLEVAISAGLGSCGLGDAVDLSSGYNLTGIHSDGKTFSDAGLDGDGYAYSAQLLTNSRVLNGTLFKLGQADQPNAVYAAGQTFKLPSGTHNALQLMGTGINGVQQNQTITVTYSDGSTTQTNLSFSDWYTPSTNVDEGNAVSMPYRDTATGGQDARQFNVYAYTIPLLSNKQAVSFTLPTNRSVVLLSATATNLPLGSEVNLVKTYNAEGIYTDGSTFPSDGGLDGGGAAYSANLLQLSPRFGEQIFVGPSQFYLAPANSPNALYGTGQPIALPAGQYAYLKLLGTAVQGDQTGQPVTITYTDGSTQIYQQSFSDWSSLSGYNNESLAIQTAYRDYNDGTNDQQAFNVYLYTLPLQQGKTVKSLTLPNNRNVVVLAATLAAAFPTTQLPASCTSTSK